MKSNNILYMIILLVTMLLSFFISKGIWGHIDDSSDWIFAYFLAYCIFMCLFLHYIIDSKEKSLKKDKRYSFFSMDLSELLKQYLILLAIIFLYWKYFKIGFYDFFFWDNITYMIGVVPGYEAIQLFCLFISAILAILHTSIWYVKLELSFFEVIFGILLYPVIFIIGHLAYEFWIDLYIMYSYDPRCICVWSWICEIKIPINSVIEFFYNLIPEKTIIYGNLHNIVPLDIMYTNVETTFIFLIIISILKLAFSLSNSPLENLNIEEEKKKFCSIEKISIFSLSLVIFFGGICATLSFNTAFFIESFQNTGILVVPQYTAHNFHTEWTFYSFHFQVLIILLVILIFYSSFTFYEYSEKFIIEFPILVLMMTFFLCALIDSCDFFVSFICIMGFSLNVYVLILSNAVNKQCCEAAIKYFYLSSFASGLLAFALWLNYVIFFSLNFLTIEDTLKEWDFFSDYSIGILSVATYFLCYGLFFKLAAFPCHLWAASVYEGSPFPVMAFFVLPVKAAILAFVFKLFYTVLKDIYSIYVYIFWFSSFFSLLFGALSALVEKKVKKFLAYSSINQMGFLLMGIVGGNSIAIQASILYLIIYITTNLGLFLILLNTFDSFTKRSILYITDFSSFANNNFATVILLTLILFSMAGIPPLVGFFGKYYLFLSLYNAKFYSLVLAGMFTSLLSSYYYLRIIKQMLFEAKKKNTTIFVFESEKNQIVDIILWAIILPFLLFSSFFFDNFLWEITVILFSL